MDLVRTTWLYALNKCRRIWLAPIMEHVEDILV